MLSLDERIDTVRRFNRLYTRRIGVLEDGYLKSPFSLAEVRVLYELAHRQRATATQLARELELDAGYLSRIVQRFVQRGLVQRTPSARDGRETFLTLSQQGCEAFEPLEQGAREQIGALLGTLSERDQQRFTAAIESIEQLLGEPEPKSPPYTLRQPREGDMGWVVERHGALYAAEYGFDTEFEALVAHIVAKFIDHFDPEHERCWIAERRGQRVGCIFLVKASKRIGKLRLFLVEPEARGMGIGRRLIDECLRFARAAGYHRVRLWTQSNLLAARHLYTQAGFTRIAEEAHHSYSQDLVAETWEIRL
jgi:DNA-binding MarR family transcriptional regulator/N-acetylglutamate synthase-like GNAT family acetyltransferase